MKRSQRRFHANVWPLIGVLMIAVVAAAVIVREHPAPRATAAPGTEAR